MAEEQRPKKRWRVRRHHIAAAVADGCRTAGEVAARLGISVGAAEVHLHRLRYDSHLQSVTPRGVLAYSADGAKVQCHACGRWLRSLNTHIGNHGLDAASYKDLYGLPQAASLLPPATQAHFGAASVHGPAARKRVRPRGRVPRPRDRVAAITAALQAGQRPADIARDFGVTTQRVYQIKKLALDKISKSLGDAVQGS